MKGGVSYMGNDNHTNENSQNHKIILVDDFSNVIKNSDVILASSLPHVPAPDPVED